MKVKWSPKSKTKLSPKLKGIKAKLDKNYTPIKNNEKNEIGKVKLIVKEFEKNVEVKEAESKDSDNNEKKSKYKNAFQILMESRKLNGGDIKSSPGSIRKVRKRKISVKTNGQRDR